MDGSGFYMQYLQSLCRRRGWPDPQYLTSNYPESGFTCLVLVNGRQYQTDLAYESGYLAKENAAMRAFMVCRNFSVNGGMLARNGIVQGLPADEQRASSSGGSSSSSGRARKSSRTTSSSVVVSPTMVGRRSGTHSSSSSTTSLE